MKEQFFVIYDDGFGGREVVDGPFDHEEAAEEACLLMIEEGEGGPENYPLPEWANYQDEVGYGALRVMSNKDLSL